MCFKSHWLLQRGDSKQSTGGKGTKEWKSEWKSVIQTNLVRAKWCCAEGLLSAGWQDELVNDCPLRQKADFVFPTSDVCASAAAFPSSGPPKYCNFFCSVQDCFYYKCLPFYTEALFSSVSCLFFFSTSRTFPWMLTTARSVIRGFGLRSDDLWVARGHTTVFHP